MIDCVVWDGNLEVIGTEHDGTAVLPKAGPGRHLGLRLRWGRGHPGQARQERGHAHV